MAVGATDATVTVRSAVEQAPPLQTWSRMTWLPAAPYCVMKVGPVPLGGDPLGVDDPLPTEVQVRPVIVPLVTAVQVTVVFTETTAGLQSREVIAGDAAGADGGASGAATAAGAGASMVGGASLLVGAAVAQAHGGSLPVATANAVALLYCHWQA
jgi:hypothetical protein